MRRLFISSLLLASIPSLGRGGTVTQINIKDLGHYGLVLIPASSPLFAQGIKTIFKNGPDATFTTELPFSALLQNNSQKALLAIAIRYEWTDVSGKTSFHDMLYNSIAIKSGFHLASAHSAIITPLRAFALSGMNGRQVSPVAANKKINQMAQQAAITISLDGALFDDGVYVGPDESGAFAKAVAIGTAGRELMKEVLARHANGESDEEVFAWVKSLSQDRFGSATTLSSIDWNYHYRARAAHALTIYHDSSGAAQAYQYAQGVIATPALSITRQQ